jgi:hypothetical protein
MNDEGRKNCPLRSSDWSLTILDVESFDRENTKPRKESTDIDFAFSCFRDPSSPRRRAGATIE